MLDYDKLAMEYAQHRRVHPGVLENLFLTSKISHSSHVLEVGCGTGNYIIALHSLAGCSAWGLDPSAAILAKAKERAGKIGFQLGRAESLGFPPGSFDLVFSVDVIHHVADRPAHFREAYRVLQTGGRMCTVTDSEWIIRHRRPLAVYFPETVEMELRRYPPISKLRELMGQVGFREIMENMVEFTCPLTDIQAYRDKAFSSLHLISEEAFARGISRLEQDLRAGPVQHVSRYLLLWGTKL